MVSGTAETRVPSFVGFLNPLIQRLLRLGVPLGPNGLITIRGRQSGRLLTTPIAFLDIDGHRWVTSPFGEVQWVRNLRAAREATITVGRREERVKAIPLTEAEAAVLFKDTVAPFVRRIRGGRFLLRSVLGAGDIIDDPVRAARTHPVFELVPSAGT